MEQYTTVSGSVTKGMERGPSPGQVERSMKDTINLTEDILITEFSLTLTVQSTLAVGVTTCETEKVFFSFLIIVFTRENSKITKLLVTAN
jgi:hypothetical protein